MDNCKHQLRPCNVPEKEQKELLFDIFGRRIRETWEQGINKLLLTFILSYVFSWIFIYLTPGSLYSVIK